MLSPALFMLFSPQVTAAPPVTVLVNPPTMPPLFDTVLLFPETRFHEPPTLLLCPNIAQ